MMVTLQARRRFSPLPCQPPRGWKYHPEVASAVQRDPAGIEAAFVRLADVGPVRLREGTGSPSQGPMSMLVPLVSEKRRWNTCFLPFAQ